MRVLYAIDSLDQGGAERSLVDLVPALVERGVRLAVVTRRPGGALERAALDGGATVLDLGLPTRRERLAGVRLLSALVAQHPPDMVHTALFESGIAGRVAAAQARVPVVSTLTGTPYGPEHRAQPGIRAMRLRSAQGVDAATARLAWRFHAPAEHVADVMATRLAVPRERIEVIPRSRTVGEPATPAARTAARAALDVADDVEVVLVLARHEPSKGLDLLLSAAQRLSAARPGVAVLVAGRSGTATPSLEQAVASAGVDVRFLGHRDDVPALLAAADVVCVPSRREGLPGVVLEALAAERPVVAFDVPGVGDALGPDHGVVVPAGDVAALAAALAAVLEEPRRAGDPATGRRRVIDGFSPAHVADRTLALWARTIAEGPPWGRPA